MEIRFNAEKYKCCLPPSDRVVPRGSAAAAVEPPADGAHGRRLRVAASARRLRRRRRPLHVLRDERGGARRVLRAPDARRWRPRPRGGPHRPRARRRRRQHVVRRAGGARPHDEEVGRRSKVERCVGSTVW